MRAVLDTSVLIAGAVRPLEGELAISAVSLAEIHFGVLVARDAVERSVAEAARAGVSGPALTPWLLARIAALTDGASVRANTALILNDARVAGELAAALSAAALSAERASG